MIMRAGDRAWIVLGVGVCVYELAAADDELLSEAADRYMLHHPWIVRVVAFVLAAHVANALHPRVDPVHRLQPITRTVVRYRLHRSM